MKTGIRTASLAAAMLIIGLGVATSGCGRFSWNNLKANKAFKEGNDHYRGGRWQEAINAYEEVLEANPDFDVIPGLDTVYFFLGHSHENLYRPSRQGEPENDAHLHKAIENYTIASQRISDLAFRRRAMEYLVAAYGPDKLNDPASAEPVVQKMIAMDPKEPTAYFQLAKIYEDAGRYEESEEALMKAQTAAPDDPAVWNAIAGYYNRQGEFEKTMDAFNRAAELEPNNPQGYHLIGSYYQEKAQKDFRLSAEQKREYIEKGIEAEDKALKLNPNYVDALVYKNILLRQLANVEKDRSRQEQLLKEADRLRNRAMELQKGGAATSQ